MNDSYCVYRHTSPSGKVYIGITSVKPNERWRGGHGYTHAKQYKFANAIKKYGWSNFNHEVLLEGRSREEACYAEKYLIRWYKIQNKSYNILDGGDIGGSLVGKDHPMYGRHETNPMYGIRGGDNPNSIKVYQYSRNGEFIKAWDSIIEAAELFDNKKSAATGISSCCKYRTPTCKGYIWRYFYQDKLEEKAPPHTKQLYQYDVEGNLVRSYNQINEIQKIYDIPKNYLGKISMCCNNKSISAFGYFWSTIKHDRYPVEKIRSQVITKMKKANIRLKEKQINKSAAKKG